MKNKLFISIYCGLMILLASCNNYLDVKPKGKIIPETASNPQLSSSASFLRLNVLSSLN